MELFGQDEEELEKGGDPRGWVIVAKRISGPAYTEYNLKPGVSYTFVVRAENSHGLSPPSQPSEPVTLESLGSWNEDIEIRHALNERMLVELTDIIPISSSSVKLIWEVRSKSFVKYILIAAWGREALPGPP